MKIQDFIKKYETKPSGYCPCIIDMQGEVYECPEGHLNTLFALDPEHYTLSEVPADMSPLFYMIQKTGAVVVDYEGQIYNDHMTPPQQQALNRLYQHGLIVPKPMNIHTKVRL